MIAGVYEAERRKKGDLKKTGHCKVKSEHAISYGYNAINTFKIEEDD